MEHRHKQLAGAPATPPTTRHSTLYHFFSSCSLPKALRLDPRRRALRWAQLLLLVGGHISSSSCDVLPRHLPLANSKTPLLLPAPRRPQRRNHAGNGVLPPTDSTRKIRSGMCSRLCCSVISGKPVLSRMLQCFFMMLQYSFSRMLQCSSMFQYCNV